MREKYAFEDEGSNTIHKGIYRYPRRCFFAG